MALAVPLSRFTSQVGGGSAFFVRPHYQIMRMDKQKAEALIRQHRYRWSKESDYAVARRAEHTYTNLAITMLFLSMISNTTSLSHTGGWLLLAFVPAALTFGFSCFCYWQSQRFSDIRRRFEDSWPQNFEELDGKADSHHAA